MRTALRLLVALAAIAGATGAPADDAPEHLLRRAFLPSTNNVHGEVRLLRRGDGTCMQTLLYSKHLRRGLHEMVKKERQSWPEGLPGHDDSARYLAAMERARNAVLGPAGDEAPDGDSDVRHRMMIEFNIGPAGAGFTLSRMELQGPEDAYVVVSPQVLASASAHPYYVSRAIRLMAAEGFDLAGDDLDRLLREAGWKPEDAPLLPVERQAVPR